MTPEFAFSRENRLLRRREFIRLSSGGRKLVNDHFILFFAQSRLNQSRLGITVSKKVGCAAVRNRVKRLCREYFRLNQQKMIGNWDLSLIARKSAADLSSGCFFDSLKSLFDRI